MAGMRRSGRVTGSAFTLAVMFGLGLNASCTCTEREQRSVTREKISVALCPTFYRVSDELRAMNYQVIKTASTQKCLALIGAHATDYALVGRTLMPGEPRYEHRVLGHGYSFLGAQGQVLKRSDFAGRKFVTDLDPVHVRALFGISRLERVDDIYEHLGGGIAVTSWARSDFTRARMLHVMEEDGSRVLLSRVPTVYCSRECRASDLASFRRALRPHFEGIEP